MSELDAYYPSQESVPQPAGPTAPSGAPTNVMEALYAIGGGGNPGEYLAAFQQQYRRIQAQQRAQELLGLDEGGASGLSPGSANGGIPQGIPRQPTTAPIGAPAGGMLSGRSAVFGRDMRGNVDHTDAGKLETPYHGAPIFGKKYLPDPNLAGAAISFDQARSLFGGSGGTDSLRRAAAAGGVRVSNPASGLSEMIPIVDVKPSPSRNGVAVEVTPKVHRLLRSNPGDRLIYSAQ